MSATSAPPNAQNQANQPLTFRGDQVPCRRVLELLLVAPRAFTNPIHDARLLATLISPSGRQITWNGFWDGGNEWRVRFSPDEVGAWHYALRLETVVGEEGSGEEVATQDGTFHALSALSETIFDRHGPIQLAADKRNLEHTDGTPFFWLADTAWNGPLRSTDDEWTHYIATRTRQRFSAVQWVATQWRSSPTDIEGQPSFTGADAIAVVPAFFQRMDRKLEAVTAAGMLNAPVMLWAVGHGANPEIDPGYGLPESEAILLARYQVARWAAYPVVWILAGDGKYFGDFAARWRRIGRATFGDLPHAPVAMHCGGEQWPADELRDETWIDILGYQSGHGDSEKTLSWIVKGPPASDWDKEPRLFQLNLEPAYENHVAYHSRQPHTPHSVRMAMYWSLLNAPTAGVTYGGHGVWGWDDGTTPPADHPNTGVPLPWRQAIIMPGGEQVAYIAEAFTNLAWATLAPAPNILLEQPGNDDIHRHMLAAANADRSLILVYTPAGDDIKLDGNVITGGPTAFWFNPRSGERQAAGGQEVGNGVVYRPPTLEDWLLVLHAQSAPAQALATAPSTSTETSTRLAKSRTAAVAPSLPAYTPATPLRAGPISLLFSNGDLRQLRVDGVEIVQRIYVAVRDHNWGTAPVTLRDLVIDDHEDHFQITFVAEHRQNDIAFTWQGSIRGEADGTINFSMDGRAESTFRRNRIGFCVLHPASAAGAPATLTHSDGSQSSSQFPTLISPHQPFMNLRAIRHEFAPEQFAEVTFEGDIFESEDQRNWTDASYKTYSTPLVIPYPVTIEAGTSIRQAVGVRLQVPPTAAATSEANPTPLTVQVGDAPVAKLPALGLCVASHGQPLSAREASLLQALHLSHLRVDLDLSRDDVAATLARAAQDANAIGATLEIALFVGEESEREMATLSEAFAASAPTVARWLLFARYANVTPARLLDEVRPHLAALAPNAPIGAGTNLYFVHLNRMRPPIHALDFVTYSINPQVHAFDQLSLVENMTAQPSSVASARAFSGDRPLVVSPITLRARFNADASGPEAPTPPGELPYAVDERQSTGFAAAWTLGSISHLAQANVAALTYFETTGWRGIMETEQGSSLPEKFPSAPGMLFPLYHLFAALAPFAGGDVLPITLSDSQQVAAISVKVGGAQCTIVGNLRDTPQRIALQGVEGATLLQTLGDDAGDIEFSQDDAQLWIDLAPYALVRLQHGNP